MPSANAGAHRVARLFDPARSGLILSVADTPGRPVNEGRGSRLDLARLKGEGWPVMARYDLSASPWPIQIETWERHPWSDQFFLSLDEADALAAVAPAARDGSPDLAAAEAWRIAAGTPFLYPAGLWHAPLFAIGRPGRFLMAMRETGRGDDTDEWRPDLALSVAPDRQDEWTG